MLVVEEMSYVTKQDWKVAVDMNVTNCSEMAFFLGVNILVINKWSSLRYSYIMTVFGILPPAA